VGLFDEKTRGRKSRDRVPVAINLMTMQKQKVSQQTNSLIEHYQAGKCYSAGEATTYCRRQKTFVAA
jgi:hypothetical protein